MSDSNKVYDVRQRKKRFGDRSKIQKGFRPEDFYSREDILHNQIKIPRSTNRVLIVPPIFDGWGFRVDEYDPEFCEGIDERMFKNTVRLCNSVVQIGYRKRREMGRGNQSQWTNYLLLMGTITGFIGFVIMEYMINTDNDSLAWVLIACLFFGASILVAIVVFIAVFFLKPKKEKTVDTISKEVKDILEQENREIYRNLGYEWYTNSKIFWLQLHKLTDGNKFEPPEEEKEEESDIEFSEDEEEPLEESEGSEEREPSVIDFN